MKTRLFFIISIFLISFGCRDEKNEIEIIPDYDNIYLAPDKLTEFPQLINGNDQKLLDTIFKSYMSYFPNFDTMKAAPTIDYKFMINEKGEIEKIFYGLHNDKRIDQLVLNTIKIWKFKPGIKDGKQVKAQYPMFITLNKGNAINENDYRVASERMPELIGGLYSIQSKIQYPEIAKRAGIEGKVYVLAFIDEGGNVTNAKVIRGIGAGCDEAALDAVKQAKFIPGAHNGKNVKVQVTIPIVFKLQ